MTREEAIEVYNGLINTKIKEAFEFFAPELAESEDERIRNGLIKLLTVASEAYLVESTGIKKDSYLAYLEKGSGCFQNGNNLNDLERAVHRGFLAAGVENVPVTIIKETAKDCLVQTGLIRYELPEDFEEAVYNVVIFMSPFSSEEELREISHRFAEQLLSLAKEEIQKPTWSEGDENMLNDILENYKLRIYLGKSEIEWIESLKHRIQLQPKQEWSEEDERMLSRCIKSVESSKNFAEVQTFKEAKDKEKDWLKTLPERFNPQPKQEWSEEDEDNIKTLIQVVRGQLGLSECRQEYIVNWLKSLRPSWRPSEEQMEALKHTAEWKRYSDPQLFSLYEHLKKLKGQEEPEYYQHFDPDC